MRTATVDLENSADLRAKAISFGEIGVDRCPPSVLLDSCDAIVRPGKTVCVGSGWAWSLKMPPDAFNTIAGGCHGGANTRMAGE